MAAVTVVIFFFYRKKGEFYLKIYFGLDMHCGFSNITIVKAPEIIKYTILELKHNLWGSDKREFSLTLEHRRFPFDNDFYLFWQISISQKHTLLHLKGERVRSVRSRIYLFDRFYFKKIQAALIHLICFVNLPGVTTKLVFFCYVF